MTTIYAVTTRDRTDYHADDHEASDWYPTREQAEAEKQRLIEAAYAARLDHLGSQVEASIEKTRETQPDLYAKVSDRYGDWLTEFRANRDRVAALTLDEWYAGEPPSGTNGIGYNDADYDITEARLVDAP